jgi:two-component system sensor histidine kinase PilS (NtrC family)
MERKVAHHERLAVIGQMAAGIAHEIRNPLASLSGSIQLLESDLAPLLGCGDKKLMTIINREIKRLNGTITSFLDYASTDKLLLEYVDMGELLDEVILLLDANIKNEADDIRIEKDFDDQIRLTLDRDQIKQVIWNLLTNAVYALNEISGNKKIRISAKIEAANEKNKNFRLEISDNGKGIAPEIRNKIFDPFYTNKTGGTGLGLATCQKIVQAHAGSIKFRSNEGEGTTFTVELPVR